MNELPMYLGTSSFTAPSWNGSFYPAGMQARDYLSFYAEHFDSVEVDSTFYECPSESTVRGWLAKTPDKFIFSVKIPQTITHENVLVDCDVELKQFLDTMEILGEKLGPVVFQFPYFNRGIFKDRHEFLDRLVPFTKKLPSDHRFAIELRNRGWLDSELADWLRQNRLALVLQDRTRMTDPRGLGFDLVTADFTYIRWLGDRKEIETMTKTWDKVVVDRTDELSRWVDYCHQIKRRGVTIYAYANNHYQGHGPATIAKFIELWNGKGFRGIETRPTVSKQPRLFE
jgi:uncharacterized protein YecE (DUF72 family)